MRLRWSERALLASGLTCWVAPWGEPVTWRGVRLTPGGVVHGLVVGEERPLAVLEGRLGVTGEAAVIVSVVAVAAVVIVKACAKAIARIKTCMCCLVAL